MQRFKLVPYLLTAGVSLGATALLFTVTAAASPLGPPRASPTPSSVPVTVPLLATPTMSGKDLLPFAVLIFVFALLVIVALLLYLYRTEATYYATFGLLGRAGKAPDTISVQAFTRVAFDETGTGPHIAIHGPAHLTVGEASAAFTATIDGAGDSEATWLLTPADAGSLSATTGATITITPAKAGPLTLTVTVGDTQVSTDLLAEAASNSTGSLPFVGSGYGSIIIAIILVATIVVLALFGTLTGEAVATLFGGLLGYIFGVTTGGGAGQKPGSASS